MVAEADRANLFRSNPKVHHHKQKVEKMEGLPKLIFTEKPFEDFRHKKYTSSLDQTTPLCTRPLNATIEDGPCNQAEISRRKIEKKAFRLKQLEICKTRTKKASPNMLHFHVELAGHDIASLPFAG